MNMHRKEIHETCLIFIFLAIGNVFAQSGEDIKKLPMDNVEQIRALVKRGEALLKTELTGPQKADVLLCLLNGCRLLGLKEKAEFNTAYQKALQYAEEYNKHINMFAYHKGMLLMEMGQRDPAKLQEAIDYFTDERRTKYMQEVDYLYLFNLYKKVGNEAKQIEAARNLVRIGGSKDRIKQCLPYALKEISTYEQVELLFRSIKNLSPTEQAVTANAGLISHIKSLIKEKTGLEDVSEDAVKKWLEENKSVPY